MGEGAAAAFAACDDNVNSGAVQEPDRRGVDLRRENGLRAAAKQRHAPARAGGASGRMEAGVLGRPRPGKRRRGERQHRVDLRPDPGQAAECRLEDASGRRKPQSSAKALPRGDKPNEDCAHQAVGERTAIGLFDLDPRVIDKPAVIDARGAGRHAGEAAEAMVDRPDVVGLDLAAGLEQILDEIDAPARAVALVARCHIGRAGRGAESAMHARAQNAFEFAGVRIGERLGGELGLHEFPSNAVVHTAEIQDAVRIEALLQAAAQPQAQSGRGLEHLDGGAQQIRRPHQRRVALGRLGRAANGARRRRAGVSRDPDEAAAPVKEMRERRFLEAGGEWSRPRGREAHPPDRAIARARR